MRASCTGWDIFIVVVLLITAGQNYYHGNMDMGYLATVVAALWVKQI